MIEVLQDLGLSRRESLCYISLLELGSTRIGPLTKRSGIPSSKIYETLDRLSARGLASHVRIGKVKHYQAADPRSLLRHLDEKKRHLEEVLPALLLKRKLSADQGVEMFIGHKAVFSMFTSIIEGARAKERYLVFSMGEETKSEAAELFFKNLSARRREKRLDVKLLKHGRRKAHVDGNVRYTRSRLPQGVTIFKDSVVMLSWADEPVAIRIRNEAIADEYREFFLEQWKMAK